MVLLFKGEGDDLALALQKAQALAIGSGEEHEGQRVKFSFVKERELEDWRQQARCKD